jgi:hypothetical protein
MFKTVGSSVDSHKPIRFSSGSWPDFYTGKFGLENKIKMLISENKRQIVFSSFSACFRSNKTITLVFEEKTILLEDFFSEPQAERELNSRRSDKNTEKRSPIGRNGGA